MSKRSRKERREASEKAEEKPQEEEQEVPQEEEQPSEETPAEEQPTEPEKEEASDDIFEVDTGKKGSGKSAIDLDKFKDMIDKVEAAIDKSETNAVKISLANINKLLGTSVSNNNSFAYRLKTGRETKPILAEHNLYVGSRGSWNGPVEDQRIAFVKTQ